MRRGFTSFILMLCMCWQGLAHAGLAVVMADEQEHSHALMHFEGQAHHHDHDDHHDDGDASGVHEDDSLASAQHLASDCGVYAPMLLGCVDLRLPRLPPEPPVPAVATPPPPPCLAGPERPPKTQS